MFGNVRRRRCRGSRDERAMAPHGPRGLPRPSVAVLCPALNTTPVSSFSTTATSSAPPEAGFLSVVHDVGKVDGSRTYSDGCAPLPFGRGFATFFKPVLNYSYSSVPTGLFIPLATLPSTSRANEEVGARLEGCAQLSPGLLSLLPCFIIF
eukprot:9474330-Pyramimonas_sp.AAC.1